MNPVAAAALAQGLAALIEIWRVNAGKPAGWTPSQQEWTDLLALSDKMPDDFKREAAERLGLPWPPMKS